MTADTNRCARGVAWISCRHTHSAFGCAVGTSHGHGGEVGAGEGIRTLDPLLGKHAGCRSRRHNSDVRLQGNCRGNRRSGARSVPLLRRAQRDTGPIIWSPGEKRWWRVAACSER